ncbi:gfo/Idh/MocA family oxidoreductase [Granulicella sp. 5B5]|uniref:Gfo/Idh/MocA family protein n=1 Tax=Granulicella sp. 5B5 TaxID=1617967 RepID=UPI0015F7331E|nr:Gfo/Idh/MocA family oxidoreductase [Granulicella sp. 5B5]QMV18789.1 gfo/Idh/MocA family oxidoreductase [Granulicella sp. 5B5]
MIAKWFATMVLATVMTAVAQQPVTVAVVGLEHGHAAGLFQRLAMTHNVKLIAVVEPDKTLQQEYTAKFHVEPSLYVDSLDAMLASKGKPQAVLIYTSPVRHREVTLWAAKHGIDAMMEKPFATTLADAIAMRDAGRRYGTKVLVNYETSWYSSNAKVLKDVADGKLGDVYKVVVHDGHNGPAEIHVQPEFLKWLTDPAKNGAGAMFDFGCYGADLMTVMMHGEAPISVTAVAQTNKPGEYPKVDDDATIIVRYPHTQAVLMPSWDWPFARKDMEAYGSKGLEIAVDPTTVTSRFSAREKPETVEEPKLPLAYTDSLEYLAALERGEIKGDHDLTATDTNIVAMQILDAAKRSVEEKRTVMITPVPK